MHICRNFGRSKKGMPVRSVVSSNREIVMIIIGAICEKGVTELTLRNPKAVQKKASGTKKRKRENDKAGEVEVNGRVGTRSEHFLDFLSSLMDTLDQFDMQGHFLAIDNAAIHKIVEIQEPIASRGCKVAYLPPYSPFLNPIELFWSKIKGNIRRDYLSADNNFSLRITEATKTVTQEDCVNWISHPRSFFDRCLGLKPML